ncbi:Importin subunit beta-1 [Linum grandiflorum]
MRHSFPVIDFELSLVSCYAHLCVIYIPVTNMAMELTELLMRTRSGDQNIRDRTLTTFRRFEKQDLPCFLLSLSAELANDEKPADSRESAGTILGNAVFNANAPENRQRWLSLDGEVKTQIKSRLINTLSSSEAGARHSASCLIAKIARIEYPKKHWPDLIGSLLLNVVDDQVPSHVKEATFHTLGYFGMDVSPDVVDREDLDKILTALVQGISDEELSSEDLKIRAAAFECLLDFPPVYYEKFGPYIHDLLIDTSEAVDHEDKSAAVLELPLLYGRTCPRRWTYILW